MRFGFSPTQAGARFDTMCAQASLAEALGFDVIWAHEHHSGGSTYPSPLMTLAVLAGVTKRIELGTNMHIRDGVLSIRQEKTGNLVEIPVHAALAAIIADTPIAGQMTFLVNGPGAASTSAGFGNAFRDWCDEADMPKRCSSHGLRKAACRRLAEAGCSEHEIASISGHENLAEVRRYTRAASRARMAKSAMATVTAAFPEQR